MITWSANAIYIYGIFYAMNSDHIHALFHDEIILEYDLLSIDAKDMILGIIDK